MIFELLVKWLRKNVSLTLLLLAAVCLTLAFGRLVRGATWLLLMPVAVLATLCGWVTGKSRLNGKQAIVRFVAPGMIAVFIYATGLANQLGRLALSVFFTIAQGIFWLSTKTPVDFTPLIITWSSLLQSFVAVTFRLDEWIRLVVAGKAATDPIVIGFIWSVLLWWLGFWSGWQLRRSRKVLRTLTPGGLVFALVLNYTGGNLALLLMYLSILLLLFGISHYEELRLKWEQHNVDYSESIAVDSMFMVSLLTILLVGLAGMMASFSWQDVLERVRTATRNSNNQVAASLGLEAPPNVAASSPFLSNGLPRQHLLDLPPELRQELVMTVSTGELPPMPNKYLPVTVNRYYWRTITYDIYTGVGWASRPAQDFPTPANTTLMELPPGYRVVHQQVHVFSDQNEHIYWTGTLVQADTDTQIAWRILPPPEPVPAHNGDMLGVLTTTNEYSAVSAVPQVSVDQLRAAGSDYPSEITNRYLQLPKSVPERVLSLARELTSTAPTPYDRALAIETYLRQFPYTLEVPPPPRGRDVVDYFLFTLKEGYCDYYASSMVVLARAAGLPARMVIGYASGTYDMTTAQYEIRQEDAHSWPEIYFPGIGWVEFEPTASQPEIFHAGGETASPPDLGTVPNISTFSWLKERWRLLVSTITGQVVLVLAGLIFSFVIWQTGEIWFLHFTPRQKAIYALYTRLEKSAAPLLPDLPYGHTPHGLQIALLKQIEQVIHPKIRPTAREIEQVVSLYEAQVFSQHAPEREQVHAGIKAWARLRWKLWIAKWGKWS